MKNKYPCINDAEADSNVIPAAKGHSNARTVNVRRLYTTNDKDGKILPAAATNRTLCLGVAPDGSALFWLESKLRGQELAPESTEQFAGLLANLTDDDGIEQTEYTRVLRGREVFEQVLDGLNNDLTPEDILRWRNMASEAVAVALSEEVKRAYVTFYIRKDWRVAYLPQNAIGEAVCYALKRLYAIFERYGMHGVTIELADTPQEERFEIADKVGSCPPVEVRQRVESIVNGAFEDWQSWAETLTSVSVLTETEKAKLDAILAKIRRSGVHFYASDFGRPGLPLSRTAVDWHINIDGKELLAGGGWIFPDEIKMLNEDFRPFELDDCLGNQPDDAYELMVQLGLVGPNITNPCDAPGYLQMLGKLVDVLAEESRIAWNKAVATYADYPTFFASIKQSPTT